MTAGMVAAYLELEDPATASSGRRSLEAVAADLAYTLELMGAEPTAAARAARFCFYGPGYDRAVRENVAEAVRCHNRALSSRDDLSRRADLEARAYFLRLAVDRAAGIEQYRAARAAALVEAGK